jgi:hypothetical protein
MAQSIPSAACPPAEARRSQGGQPPNPPEGNGAEIIALATFSEWSWFTPRVDNREYEVAPPVARSKQLGAEG